jgi:hypothetical protein
MILLVLLCIMHPQVLDMQRVRLKNRRICWLIIGVNLGGLQSPFSKYYGVRKYAFRISQ